MIWLDIVAAWLLVAGSLYQGALELRAQDHWLLHRQFEMSVHKVSAWWLFVLPVYWMLKHRAQRENYDRFMAKLSHADVVTLVHFFEKATGWFIVTTSALLMGVALVAREFGWHGVAFVPALFVTIVNVVRALMLTGLVDRDVKSVEP